MEESWKEWAKEIAKTTGWREDDAFRFAEKVKGYYSGIQETIESKKGDLVLTIDVIVRAFALIAAQVELIGEQEYAVRKLLADSRFWQRRWP